MASSMHQWVQPGEVIRNEGEKKKDTERKKEVTQIIYEKKHVKTKSSACSFRTREQGCRQRKKKKGV